MRLKETIIERRARAILGIKQIPTTDEIKRAWHSKAKKFHPDKTQGKTEKLMALINAANEYLTEPQKKDESLLADDFLVSQVIEINKQTTLKNSESYEEWRKRQFYDFVGR